MAHIFERTELEDDAAWSAFRAYRDSPNRNPKAVYVNGVRLGTEITQKYYNEYSWRERVQAYDRHFDAAYLEAMEDKVRQIGRESGNQHTVVVDNLVKVAAAEVEKLMKASLENEGPMLDPRVSLKMAETAIKLAALLKGQPTEIHGVSEMDFTGWTAAELRQWKELKAKGKKGT